MEYSNFLKLMLGYRKISRDISDLHKIGVDLIEGKYRIEEQVWNLFETSMSTIYDSEGIDWINWFIFESDWGEEDWSKADCYRVNKEGKSELVHKKGEMRYGATDSEGNPIAYSFESLYELLENEHKIKNKNES